MHYAQSKPIMQIESVYFTGIRLPYESALKIQQSHVFRTKTRLPYFDFQTSGTVFQLPNHAFCTRGTRKQFPNFENQSKGTRYDSRNAILTVGEPKARLR